MYIRIHVCVCVCVRVCMSKALGAGGPELRTLVAGAAMRRQGELDGPRPSNCCELPVSA